MNTAFEEKIKSFKTAANEQGDTGSLSLYKRLRTYEQIFSLFSNLIVNPDEKVRSEGISVYRHVASDPVVEGCVKTITQALKSREWEIVPNGQSKTTAKLYEKVFNALLEEDVITKISKAIFWGQSYLDIIWKRDKWIVPEKLVEMDNSQFVYKRNSDTGENEPHYYPMDGALNPLPVPQYKMLIPTMDPSASNPYGRGLFATCYKPVFIKDNAVNFWAIMVEDHGTPKLDVTIPGPLMNDLTKQYGSESAALARVLADVEKIKANAAFVHGFGVEVKPLTTNTQESSLTHKDLVSYCDMQTSIALLGHNGASQSTPGKLGSEDAAMSVLKYRIDSYAEFLSKEINKLFRWIHELNSGKGDAPQIKFAEKNDLAYYLSVTDYISRLKESGWEFTKSRVAELLDENEDDLIYTGTTPPPPADDMPSDEEPTEEPATEEPKDQEQPPEEEQQQSHILTAEVSKATDEFEAKLSAQADADYDALKQFSDMVINDKGFEKATKEMMDYMAEFIGTSNSVEEMISKLNDIYEDMPTSKLLDLVTRMQIVVTAYGISAAAASEEED